VTSTATAVRCDADDAEERVPGDSHSGQVRGLGHAVVQVPSDQHRISEQVAQETEARGDRGEAEAVRDDLLDLQLEQITGFGALDPHRPGQRVQEVEVEPGHIRQCRVGGELTVRGVAGVEHHRVARRSGGDRLDVRVPPIVPGAGILGGRRPRVYPHLDDRHQFLVSVSAGRDRES